MKLNRPVTTMCSNPECKNFAFGYEDNVPCPKCKKGILESKLRK